nr:RsmB/NOP family class I SAM-dependent RNA methyltransferase [Pseudanabaena sp. FACHB-2040]
MIKLSQRLFPEPGERDAFVEALIQPQEFASAILWTRSRPEVDPFPKEAPLSWQPGWVDRLSPSTRPGQHPLHGEGYFYCLDFSSVFAATVLAGIAEPVSTVLDLCAAPGGKSLFAWQALQPDHLWCNEVIRKRVRILISNLKRCGATSSLVFNLDPSVFAEQMPRSANLVLVDAPCSGQSLLAKGETALGCFHPVNLNKNANRQKRILANAAEVVAGQGYLAYMTCTFSPEENEQVCEWFLSKFPQFKPVAVSSLASYQSHLANWPCYRLWPQSGLGAGAFTALFRNTGVEPLASNPTFLDQHGMILYTAEGRPADNRSDG